MTIIELTRDWLKSLVPQNAHVPIDIAALAVKVSLDLGFGSDQRLDETERLEILGHLNNALLAAGLLEVA